MRPQEILVGAALVIAAALVGLSACADEDDLLPATTSSAGGATSSGGSSSAGGSGGDTGGAGGAGGAGGEACPADGPAPNEVVPGTTDPTGGVFTLDEALEDLPMGPGPLRAIITTDLGVLTCEMHPDEAPNGVANFVGLARGRRPWRDPMTSQWVKRAFYDGLIFHRVIPGFVAQGGDPRGTGFGGPGYSFDDEISDLTHQPGTLAHANSGADTNGSQFYIAEVALPGLDGGYTIFGSCEPVSVVEDITSVATDDSDKPLEDVHIQTVEITRCAPDS